MVLDSGSFTQGGRYAPVASLRDAYGEGLLTVEAPRCQNSTGPCIQRERDRARQMQRDSKRETHTEREGHTHVPAEPESNHG